MSSVQPKRKPRKLESEHPPPASLYPTFEERRAILRGLVKRGIVQVYKFENGKRVLVPPDEI